MWYLSSVWSSGFWVYDKNNNPWCLDLNIWNNSCPLLRLQVRLRYNFSLMFIMTICKLSTRIEIDSFENVTCHERDTLHYQNIVAVTYREREEGWNTRGLSAVTLRVTMLFELIARRPVVRNLDIESWNIREMWLKSQPQLFRGFIVGFLLFLLEMRKKKRTHCDWNMG